MSAWLGEGASVEVQRSSSRSVDAPRPRASDRRHAGFGPSARRALTGVVWWALASPVLLLPPARPARPAAGACRRQRGPGAPRPRSRRRDRGRRARPGGPAPRPAALRARTAWAWSGRRRRPRATSRRERRRFDLVVEDLFVGPSRSVRKPDWLIGEGYRLIGRGCARAACRLEHDPRDAGDRPGHAAVRWAHRLAGRARSLEPGHGLRPGPPSTPGTSQRSREPSGDGSNPRPGGSANPMMGHPLLRPGPLPEVSVAWVDLDTPPVPLSTLMGGSARMSANGRVASASRSTDVARGRPGHAEEPARFSGWRPAGRSVDRSGPVRETTAWRLPRLGPALQRLPHCRPRPLRVRQQTGSGSMPRS